MSAALSRLRRRTRRKEIALEDYLPQFREDGHHLVRPVVDWSADLEQCLANAQMQQLVRQAIELLQPLDKAVLVLSDFEELLNREIGEALGLTVLAVKARLHRARLVLRGQLAVALVLQRGLEMWCNAARQSCMEGGQHDGPDRDHAQDGLGDPRYCAPGGGVARLSRHLQPVVSAA